MNNGCRGPSRLPRRLSNQPNVADLIRKYQDILPAQGVQDLMKTALPPPPPPPIISESEQEFVSRARKEPHRPRYRQATHARKSSLSTQTDQDTVPGLQPMLDQASNATMQWLDLLKVQQATSPNGTQPPCPAQGLIRPAFRCPAPISESEQGVSITSRKHSFRARPRQQLTSKPSNSDFEHSFAANIAPRYLANPRKSLATGTRIPTPKPFAFPSRVSSRHPSPESVSPVDVEEDIAFSGHSSPPEHHSDRAVHRSRLVRLFRDRPPDQEYAK